MLLLALALLARGQLIENVPARSDPAQTYTLYLPSHYTTERPWPLLFVFDPRGHGTEAAELFRTAAEEHGWIVMSANGTRSDTDPRVNDRAVTALLGEIRRYAVDEHRLYAAGFSGTANVAWFLGQQKNLAGVIASGPPWIHELDPAHVPFAYWAAAGTTDINYLDAKRIDRELARHGRQHRLEIFDGPHQWMPQPFARRAIAWMEHPVSAEPAQETAADRYEERTINAIIAALRRILAPEDAPPMAEIERQLNLPAIRKTASQADDMGLAARRVLNRLRAQTGFYLPEKYRAQRDERRAALVLSIASAVKEQ